ncbi:MAG: T9SS type A sorting domain-containing protein [Bacteroidota bacterium]
MSKIYLFISLFFVTITLQAQFLTSGKNLFSTAQHISASQDSSLYISGEFLTYEVINENGFSTKSRTFAIGDSVAFADTCNINHEMNKPFVAKLTKEGIPEWIQLGNYCDTLAQFAIIETVSDNANNLYVLIVYTSTFDLNNTSTTSIAAWDMALYKISPNGSIVWNISNFGSSPDSEIIPNSMIYSPEGISISGTYKGSLSCIETTLSGTTEQFFLLTVSEDGTVNSLTAGSSSHENAHSELRTIEHSTNTKIFGSFSAQDSMSIVHKQAGGELDTIKDFIALDTLYAIDRINQYAISEIADTFCITQTIHITETLNVSDTSSVIDTIAINDAQYFVDTFFIDNSRFVIDTFLIEDPYYYVDLYYEDTAWFYYAKREHITDKTVIVDSLFSFDTSQSIRKNYIVSFEYANMNCISNLSEMPNDMAIDTQNEKLLFLFNHANDVTLKLLNVPEQSFPASSVVQTSLTGEAEWFKTAYCKTDTVRSTGIHIDNSHNIYISNYINKQSGTDSLFVDGTAYVPLHTEDAALVKIEEATRTVEWIQFLGDSASDKIEDVAVMDEFSIYAAGFYSKQIDYNHLHIETSGQKDVFVAEIDPMPAFDLSVYSSHNDSIPLCEGDSVLLVAESSHNCTFKWIQNGEFIDSSTDSLWVTTSGTYHMQAYSLEITRNGNPYMKQSPEFNYTFHPYPNDSIQIIDSALFCAGDSAILFIETNSSDSCTWYDTAGNVFPNNQIIVYESNNYFAHIESAEGCISYSDTVQTQKIPLPQDSLVILGGTNLFCLGDSVSVECVDSIANMHSWYRNKDSLFTTENVRATFYEEGNYSVIIRNDFGCSTKIEDINLTEITPPHIQTWFDAAETGICENQETTIQISSHNDTEYIWFFGEDTIQKGTSNILSVSDEGDYSAHIITSGVCRDTTDTFNLTVHPKPHGNIFVHTDSIICDNESTVLEMRTLNTVNYSWYRNNVILSSEEHDSIEISTSGTYFGIIINEYNCTDTSRKIPIVVKTSPTPEIYSPSGKTGFCDGDSVQLAVQQPQEYIYNWICNDSQSDIDTHSLYTAGGGEFSVLATDTVFDCSAESNTIYIEKYELPQSTLTVNKPNPLCQRDTVTVTADADGETYTWYRNNTDISQNNHTIHLTQNGNYFAHITNSNNCSANTDTIEFEFLYNPIPPLQQDREYLSTQSYKAIQWYTNDTVIPGETEQIYLTRKSGNYSVEVTHDNMCRAQSKPIEVCVPFPSIFQEHNTLISTHGTAFQWFYENDTIFGAHDSIYQAQLTGSYSVDVTLPDGCTSRSNTLNICYPVPTISIQANNVLESSLGLSYQWYINDSIIDGAIARLYVPQEAGTYTVELTNLEGCTAFSDPVFTYATNSDSPAFLEDVFVFPNPFSDIFTLKIPNNYIGSQCELYTQNGIQVYSAGISHTQTSHNLSFLPSGTYTVLCKHNSKVIWIKSIVKIK